MARYPPVVPKEENTPKPRRPRGEGTLRKRRDGACEASLDLGVGPDGKRVVQWFRGKTNAEALRRRREALDKLARGESPASSRMTVEQWIRHWLDTNVSNSVLQEQRKPMTEQSYRTLAAEYVIPSLGRVRLDKLTSADVDGMTGTMKRAGYAPNTIRLARALLRTALNAALGEGLVARNVVANSVAPNVAGSARKAVTLTFEQARSLVASVSEEPYGPLIELALWTGMRKGELLALRWEEIDFDRSALLVAATHGRVSGKGIVRSTPKTKKSLATVPLVASAVEALRRQQAAQEKAAAELGTRWRGSELVFHGPWGGPLDPSKATKMWNDIRDARGLPHSTFHDLRHTTATLLRHSGVPVDVTSRILRHSSIVMTADVYTSIDDTLTTEALAKLERAIKDETQFQPVSSEEALAL